MTLTDRLDSLDLDLQLDLALVFSEVGTRLDIVLHDFERRFVTLPVERLLDGVLPYYHD